MPNDSPATYAYRKQAQAMFPPILGELCDRCHLVKRLHIHHKNGDIWDNHPDNIEKICGGCHNQIEPRRKS